VASHTERRVLTALFVDVVGSTALTTAFGPERIKRTLDGAFAELRALIASEGGVVEKFVGDAIHAVFGAPVAHADDPHRALRAAHACLRWAKAQASASIPLDVRIGVETGEAIVDLGAVEGDRQQFALENASRGPHLQSHVHRERAHLLLARGDWPRLVALATTAEKLVADNPATAFCYAITTARALGAVACAMLGQRAEAEALLARAETRLTSLPFSHEEGLLLGYGVLGRRPEVARLADEIRARYGALLPHFFRRTQATVLTMFERWSDLAEPLAALDAAASQGSRFLAALATAIREERAARRGGPAATHAALRALGYRGWSTLLAWRPAP
jgi:hypothetical protein